MTNMEIVATVLLVLAIIGIEITAALQPPWLRLAALETRWKLAEWREDLAVWASCLLPRWLVYRAAIRLMAHATTGRYGDTVVPELTAIDALKRWDAKND